MWRPAMSFKSKRKSKASDGAAGCSQTKRSRRTSGTDDEDIKGLSFGQTKNSKKTSEHHSMSKIYNSTFRSSKPAELFRKDLISAMKLADSDQLAPEDYWLMTDQWKEEWERGVQVPVNPETLPQPNLRILRPEISEDFKMPKKYLHNLQDEAFNADLHIVSAASLVADKACRYDLDDLDTEWLKLLNDERDNLGLPPVDEVTIELIIEELEARCFDSLQRAIKNQEGLGIEFDEDVICDVCRSPDSEDGNEMVFCDSCNICVHQACYGITSIPEGSWICRTCALGIRPSCILCPNKGGAMKSTKGGCEWAHVSCALWVPEVSIGCVEKMEPITKISQIPPSRWSLLCTLCKEKVGTCIQCSVKTCKTAYHVTCAFKHGLEMKAIIDEDNEDDGVKLRSYCEKHGKKAENYSSESDDESLKLKKSNDRTDRTWKELEMSTDDKAGAREKRIQLVKSEFYNYVSPKQVSETLSVDPLVADFVYQYWKLKRRSNMDRPLLTPKAEESDALSRQQEDSLYARMKMFVHLRQDLERVRNLCYMVSRREKISRSLFRAREEVFKKQVKLINQRGLKLTEKERQAIVHANHSDNIYDRLYSGDPDRFPLPSAIVSALEGKETSIYDLQVVKRFVKKPEKVVLPNTVSSADRMQEKQPNPYAKQYFSGIRRSNRRIAPFFSLDDEKQSDANDALTNDSNNLRFKGRKPRKDSEMTEDSCDVSDSFKTKARLRKGKKDDLSNVDSLGGEENKEFIDKGGGTVEEGVKQEEETKMMLNELERVMIKQEASLVSSSNEKASNIKEEGGNCLEPLESKVLKESNNVCRKDFECENEEEKVLNDLKEAVSSQIDGEQKGIFESKENDERVLEILDVVEENVLNRWERDEREEHVNKEPGGAQTDLAIDEKSLEGVKFEEEINNYNRIYRRLRSRESFQNGKIKSDHGKGRIISKNKGKQSDRPSVIVLEKPLLFRPNSETKKEEVNKGPKIFPRTCLAGYRIPKKKSESSDSENNKDTRGNSPLSPLSDIATKHVDLYNQKRCPPSSQPFLQQQQLSPQRQTNSSSPGPWSGENHSPRLVIKLRKDPDSPGWRSDAYNNNNSGDGVSNEVSFRVIQNDWDSRNSHRPEQQTLDLEHGYGDNCSRYPMRFRNVGSKPPKQELAS